MKFDNEQAKYLAKFIAKNMIAREDVRASQLPSGHGAYVRVDGKWKMKDLIDHVVGAETYGHYLLDQDSQVKVLAFDIDLTQSGVYLPYAETDLLQYTSNPDLVNDEYFIECNPRDAWVDRKHPARPWLKQQLRELADRFTAECYKMGLPTFATYSGSKGVHVYGILDGRTPAKDARILAHLIADNVAATLSAQGDTYEFTASKGKSFYAITCDSASYYRDFGNFSIEVFPKQDQIEPNRLGNLMRLPFGKNLKNPKDPTFVIDQTQSPAKLVPITDWDTLKYRLESGNPWADLPASTPVGA